MNGPWKQWIGSTVGTALAAWALALPSVSMAGTLEDELGRSESRIYAAPFLLAPGRSVWDYSLEARLERLDYHRVRGRRPTAPGEYFWGHDVFWIFRRAHRRGGEDLPAELVGLRLGEGGEILGWRGDPDAAEGADDGELRAWLEPELLAESLTEDRAPRRLIDLDAVPEHVWRSVLAAEDARFFEHAGLDARSLARALLANARAGRVTQGGSTITQQLIKNRDLTSRRSLSRKASEAVRALALEAEYDKREILQTYLNQVYLGHVGGVAVHGLGTAARAYFAKPARRLTLPEAALLAAIIQGPNRLSPVRHADRVRQRRDWVLSRLEELGWATPEAAAAARREAISLRVQEPSPPIAPHFRAWVAALAEDAAPRRVAKGRGVVVESTLDPILQELAEDAVGTWLGELRRRHPSLRDAPLQAALVAVEPATGAVLAYVGGDPAGPRGGFDRARNARRQPGSAVKPLLLLEAFETCGGRDPLHPASRVADEPLRLDLPSGPWSPVNSDGRFHGVVSVREALRQSLNVPFVRIARWCGLGRTARRLRRAGLDVPRDPPPAFALGAVETSPLELAGAYTVFAQLGRAARPQAIERLERPGGRRLRRFADNGRRVSDPATAYLIRDLMLGAVRDGTARGAAADGLDVAAKTGTTSERRDAWLAGHAGGLVTVVWVGRDDDRPLDLTGSAAAAPLWKRFMESAVPARPPHPVDRPEGVVSLWVDPETGLLVRRGHRRATPELFSERARPPRDRFWRRDEPVPVVR